MKKLLLVTIMIASASLCFCQNITTISVANKAFQEKITKSKHDGATWHYFLMEITIPFDTGYCWVQPYKKKYYTPWPYKVVLKNNVIKVYKSQHAVWRLVYTFVHQEHLKVNYQ